ncbi:MAG: hypothetical protein M3198_19270 [Actinomycetota bacterium]|nr:hypothetical protein [Actinomycetota bacterium]
MAVGQQLESLYNQIAQAASELQTSDYEIEFEVDAEGITEVEVELEGLEGNEVEAGLRIYNVLANTVEFDEIKLKAGDGELSLEAERRQAPAEPASTEVTPAEAAVEPAAGEAAPPTAAAEPASPVSGA